MAGLYNYIVKDQNGRTLKGKISATSDYEAAVKLRMLNLRIIKVGLGSLKVESKSNILRSISTSVSTAELSVFTRQLSVMMDAGLGIIQALEMQGSQCSNRGLKTAILEIRESIEKGQDLAFAMAKQKHIFDSLYVSIIKAGQTSGKLDDMLKKLADLLDKSAKFKKQLVSALGYPAFIMIFASGMVSVMLIYVVPMLAKSFIDSGKALPGITQMVIDWSNWLKLHYLVFLVGIIGTVVGLNIYKKTPFGKRQLDALMLRLPIFGPIVKKIAVARFANTMATLTASGVDLIDSIDICGKASGNAEIETALQEVKIGVQKGKGVAAPLLASNLFPPLVGSMVAIGEASGKMDAMLAKVASMYEEDVDAALAASLKLVEPIMFVVIGGIVGFILMAMYLPIFDLANTL